MNNRKTVILSVAIAVVATVPAVAWAVGGPFGADPRPPTVGGDAETDAPYGWMDQMHNDRWNNGELPEDFPADAADWMNQMHDYMWGVDRSPAQIDPRGRGSNDSVPSGSNIQGADSVEPVPGPGRGGCGMWGGRERAEATSGT